MAQDLFETVVNFTLDREGRVVSHDPRDRGGPTAYGISERAHPKAWEGGPPTLEEALDIYRLCYWKDGGVENLPPAVAAATFDYRVHSGDTAIRELQEMVGVEPDGIIGPNTLAAVQAFGEMMVGRALTERRRSNLLHLTRVLEDFRRWGRGWSSRCDKVVDFLTQVILPARRAELTTQAPMARPKRRSKKEAAKA